MRFTVVTPVRNGMPWLPAAARSVLAQRRDAEVEYVVLDPGSTDGTREWLTENLAGEATLLFEEDEGQSDALASALARAGGDVLSWLNADDVLEEGAIARVARAFQERPDASLVSGLALYVDEEDRVIGVSELPARESLEGMLRHPHNLPQPAVFFRKSAYDACGGIDRTLDLCMDVDLWLKLAKVGSFVALRGDVLARFRVHASAKSQRRAAEAAREDLAVRRRHGMPLASYAAIRIFGFGFVYPVVAPVWRRTLGRALQPLRRGRW